MSLKIHVSHPSRQIWVSDIILFESFMLPKINASAAPPDVEPLHEAER